MHATPNAIWFFNFSVMTKMGKLLPIIHQLCHAHGIHLAVCDVLYKKAKSNEVEEESGTEGSGAEDRADEDEEWEEDEGDWLGEATDHVPELIVAGDAVNKVRKIVRKFRRSTCANDNLQDKIREKNNGKEKQLDIDVK